MGGSLCGPVLPSATPAPAGGRLPLPLALALLGDLAQTLMSQGWVWLYWPRAPLCSLGPKDWSGPPPPQSPLPGGLKCVYFLDLFSNKKEKEQKEQKVLTWRCGETGAGTRGPG